MPYHLKGEPFPSKKEKETDFERGGKEPRTSLRLLINAIKEQTDSAIKEPMSNIWQQTLKNLHTPST
jgi:hypothetical protein